MKKTLCTFIFFILAGTVSAVDTYISYDPLLRMRVGINYKKAGLYVRSAIDKTILYEDKGATLGFNVNETMFEYKNMECILNAFTGYGLLHTKYTNANQPVSNRYFWKRQLDFGLIPEIRFYKKASLTVSPVLYRYTWSKDTYYNDIEFSSFDIQKISFNDFTIGFKFYFAF